LCSAWFYEKKKIEMKANNGGDNSMLFFKTDNSIEYVYLFIQLNAKFISRICTYELCKGVAR
jgi:hypothetical protein